MACEFKIQWMLVKQAPEADQTGIYTLFACVTTVMRIFLAQEVMNL